MALRLPDGNVQAMQQFVGQSPWDWKPIWERLGRRMTAELEPESAWVIDDTGFPKQTASLRHLREDGQLPGRR